MSQSQNGRATSHLPSANPESTQHEPQATKLDLASSRSALTAATDVTQEMQPEAAPERKPVVDVRVRFSVDEDRESQAERRVKAPSLPVNSSSVLPTYHSAKPPQSARSPLSAGTGPSSLPERSRSHSRNRGYSLRRSLFAKNIQGQNEADGVIIEMEPAGPSSESSFSRTDTSKGEKSQTSVTVSTLDLDENVALPSRPVYLGRKARTVHNHHQRWSAIQNDHIEFLRKLRRSFEKAKKRLLRMNDLPPTASGRHIDLDFSNSATQLDERTGTPYVSNVIRSSRYTLLNFVPRQLFAQFGKLANFYFLTVSILQMIPGLSTTGTYTTIVPLLVFVSISMAKEGYDDLRRYRLDKEENRRETLVLTSEQDFGRADKKRWQLAKWQDVKVGDVIMLERDSAIPADLVLLHAQDINGTAYIETMALDGETNLKTKRPLPQLAERCLTPQAIAECCAHFTVEDPNMDLYNFDGKVNIIGETAPLTNGEILYRGSVLRNTQAVIGLVIFTGEECKIRMNANKNPRIKAPALQAVVNRVVIILVFIVLALAVGNSVAYEIWSKKVETKSWYLNLAKVAFGPIFTSYIIMFNTMIPLSLYVSLEIVKVCQMFLMNDVDMYDADTNTPMEARTSTINEELGQVSYIFSDKTGTLTDNTMLFRKLSVAGTAWLHDNDLQEPAHHVLGNEKLVHKKRKIKGKGPMSRKSNISTFASKRKSDMNPTNNSGAASTLDTGRPSAASATWQSTTQPMNSMLGGRSEEMLEYIQRRPHTMFARKAKLFILSLALCHTCIPEKDEEGDVSFQAASPDELALVTAAQELGYIVVSRQPSTITIKIFSSGADEDSIYETFEILDVIEFSSARKRMSVIVRMPDQRICIFCKGADSTVKGLLRLSGVASAFAAEIKRHNSQRKSLETHEVLRRRSQQISSITSHARTSFNFARTSSVGISSGSGVSLKRNRSVRDSVDHWLKERETDVDLKRPRDSVQYYTPRLSGQPLSPLSGNRPSFESYEGRSSVQVDDQEDLVDEALVMNDNVVLERCFQHINDFATEGLRTLMYAYRQIGEEDYATWKRDYLKATTSLVDRQMLVERAAERIECQLELVGATAIEDKLQKGVPDTIDRLRRAGIKLWMLTGDKRETAINIGHSCRLVKDYSTVVILDHEKGNVDQRMATALSDFQGGQNAHTVVVVDGQTLSLIEAEQPVKKLFIELAVSADSVICCRASPSQKASLVKAIRTRVKGSITLAVGDGANDIAMIQEAHIGIGITGKEGFQAARSSDYSIAQFRFLLKLLLVHGRWNYIRVCKYTLGTFWKEMLFYLTQAAYQHYNGYTGTSLYEPWSLSMFNTLFTSLPVIFMGVFEKDLAASTLLAAPELYTKGQRNGGFNLKIYFFWAFMAVSEAMLVFFTSHALYGQALFTKDNDLYATGALSFTCCIMVISLKLQVLELHNKSAAAIVAIVLSVGGWYLWNILLSIIYTNNVIYKVKHAFLEEFGQNVMWWLTLIVMVVAFTVYETSVSTIRSVIFPTDVDIFQAYEQDREVRKRFEEAAAEYLQQGWDRGTKVSSVELAREAAVEAEREQQIEELLKRPRTMTNEEADGGHLRKRNSWAAGMDDVGTVDSDEEAKAPKKSSEAAELFSRGFGSVKQGQHLR